jgi:hypothetical protein
MIFAGELDDLPEQAFSIRWYWWSNCKSRNSKIRKIYGYEHWVLTPDRVICSTTADEVVLPGLTGQVGVLEGHAALITALDTITCKTEWKWTPIILCGGLAEIDQNRVTVLVNDVEELM